MPGSPTNWSGMLVQVAQPIDLACFCWFAQPSWCICLWVCMLPIMLSRHTCAGLPDVACLSRGNQTVWHTNSSDMHLWSEMKIIYKSTESNTTPQYSKWNAAGQFDQLQNKACSCKTLSKLRVGKFFGSMLEYVFLRQVDKLLVPRKHAFPHPGWNIMYVTIKWPLH